ncbi:MAG TPA: ECF-type sigma factor [Vicinamibacteria bacterium]
MAREEVVAEVTALLQTWNVDLRAREQVLELLYDELKRRAAGQLRRERPNHTLSPTALVNEGYLRLASQDGPWRNRTQFLAVASRMMRRVLVDHARSRLAGKRSALRVELDEQGLPDPETTVDVLGLDEALDDLARKDDRSARLVELRFFGGLTQDEAADALCVSRATAARDWTFARAWLFRRLRKADNPSG